ncbi:MAG TPA: N-acetyl-D-Glu racemase DgcA [Xanthobacteraceae bacterium]|nr:N-acetyl-D-Glu racemase DgcA [Xanthobacteraceae bacterium]
MPRNLALAVSRWPIAGRFTISRGAKTEAEVIVAEIRDGDVSGRGECVPYGRYGETIDSVRAGIEKLADRIEKGLGREELQSALPPGAARNAVDCALWDLDAKRAKKRVWEIAALPVPAPVITAYTISLDTPEAMAEAARRVDFPLLKLKLGAAGDPARLRAVRSAKRDARLIVDANEGWRRSNLAENFAACAEARVEMIEQPLPADDDRALLDIKRPVPVCADESVHDRASLAALAGKYDLVNVKLDKTGGLTEALALVDAAERAGFGIMLGSMVGTSLGVAPALLLAARARFVDLDGPLLLARDRPDGLRYNGAEISPPDPALWG